MRFAALLAAALLLQQQEHRPPVKDGRGLLKINRDHFGLSAATGGEPYFWAAGEFAASSLKIALPGDPVVLAYGTLTTTTRRFEIPVERGVDALSVFVSIQRKDLAVLLRPDGSILRDGLQSYQHMLIADVPDPEPGLWTLELTGEGIFAVSAKVRGGAIGFERARIEKGVCTIAASGAAAVSFAFVAADGTVLAPIVLARDEDGTYRGKCETPGVPFRVAVSGTDAHGAPFRRIESHLH